MTWKDAYDMLKGVKSKFQRSNIDPFICIWISDHFYQCFIICIFNILQ